MTGEGQWGQQMLSWHLMWKRACYLQQHVLQLSHWGRDREEYSDWIEYNHNLKGLCKLWRRRHIFKCVLCDLVPSYWYYYYYYYCCCCCCLLGRDADNSPPSSSKVVNEWELHILSLLRLHRCVVGLLYPFIIIIIIIITTIIIIYCKWIFVDITLQSHKCITGNDKRTLQTLESLESEIMLLRNINSTDTC
jgi:hypothetical protein